MRWPPVDSSRNRAVARWTAGGAALAAFHFFVLGYSSGAPVPWALFTVALATILVCLAALLLMAAARRGDGADTPTSGTDASRGPDASRDPHASRGPDASAPAARGRHRT